MGYFIIDRDELEHRLRLWNNDSYYNQAMGDIVMAKANPSYMLEALVEAEQQINKDIQKLENKKRDIGMLMDMAKGVRV